MWSAEDEAEWARLENERKRRDALVRKIKREAHYRKLRPLPRCCETCFWGDFEHENATCWRGEESFDVSPFGICDHYKRRRP